MKLLAAACCSVGLALAGAAPAAGQSQGEATVSVLHAVPDLTVDVYANGEELLPGFEPGTLTDPLSLPAGSYDLAVYAEGDDPQQTEPAIEAENVRVPAGANATVVAHLDEGGDPTLTPFVNDTSSVPAGQARLTVRHTAAAPAVDVRADGSVLVPDLANPDEASTEVPAGGYSADVVLAGTDQVAIGPADVMLEEGTHTIVYAWGSAEDESLDLAVQTIGGLHSAPSGVPGGQTGEAAAVGSSSPAWAVALGLLGLTGLGIAGRRLAPARVRGRG
jgi:hypothetical protein